MQHERRRTAPGHYGALAFVILMLVAYVVTAAIFLAQAPDKVPSHYNGVGKIDGWSSKAGFLGFMSLIGIVLPILFAIPWPWARMQAFVNVPFKEYWIKSGRTKDFADRVITFMRLVAGLLCILSAAICWISLTDALASGARRISPGWVWPVIIGIFVAGTLAGVVKLFRDLQPPPNTPLNQY